MAEMVPRILTWRASPTAGFPSGLAGAGAGAVEVCARVAVTCADSSPRVTRNTMMTRFMLALLRVSAAVDGLDPACPIRRRRTDREVVVPRAAETESRCRPRAGPGTPQCQARS